jgi:two-component system sensor kinase FixL
MLEVPLEAESRQGSHVRLHLELGASDNSRAPIGKSVATGFAALAGLCGLLSFLGWVIDAPSLAGLGFEQYPIWPWTALGYLVLSMGFIAAIQGRTRIAHYLWLVPLGIALIALFEHASGVDLAFDRALFPESILDRPSPYPGRPGLGPSATLILLSLAGYASRQERLLRDELGSLLASAALALGAAAVVLVLLSSISGSGATPISSLPGALAATALAIAFIIWNAEFGWVRLFAQHRPEWRSLRLILPLVLLLPLFPSVLAALIVPTEQSLSLASHVAIVTGNILIVALVTYGALIRVARSQAAMLEIAQALDTAIVALTTLDGRVLHWSRGCERLYGWTAAEAVGRPKYELLRSRRTDREGSAPDLGRRVQELIEIRHDGREVSVVERVHRIDTPGRAPVLALSMSDISETAAAMHALRASEDRLAEAAAVHELGVFEWDVGTGRFIWSPGTEQRLGVVPGSLDTYESWAAQIEPSDLERVNETLAQAVASRAHKYRYRYRFRQPNGNVRAVEGSSRAFYDEDGRLVRTIGVILDVSEREEREAALKRSEGQLRSVLDTVPDAMVAVDDHGVIRQFSGAAEVLWGYRSEEVIGRHLSILTPESERTRYWGAITRALETHDERLLGRMRSGIGVSSDGHEFPLEYRVGLTQGDGQPLYIVFFRDTTERLAAEERLSALNSELAHVSRQSAMSELAADMAHELNQPLSATSNFLAAARMLVEKGDDKDRVAELLRMGGEQTQRAGQIIRRLRDFTARGEVDMRPEPLDRTLRDAAELVLVGTGQFHIRLTWALDPEAQTIYADRIQVQQVVVNLLRNAMDALRGTSAENREINIGSRLISGQMAEITVSDTGPGIPEKLLNQLFSRFTSTKQPGAGMGIGLSISKRIIEAHGGTLSAENRHEGGAMFRFTLPTVGEDVEE